MDYDDAIKLFYNIDAVCPSCGKRSTIQRSQAEEGGRTIYKMKCSNCGWKLNITLPVHINVFKQLSEQEKRKNLIISQLTSDNLKEKKAEYKSVKDSIGKLHKIIDDADADRRKYDAELLQLITDMTKSLIERTRLYNAIKEPSKITKDLRNKFIQVIKDEGKISDKRMAEVIKNLAGKDVERADAENYFKWLMLCNGYIGMNEQLKITYKNSQTEAAKSREIPLNFIAEPAKVSESTTREKIMKEEKDVAAAAPQIKTVKIAKDSIEQTPIDDKSNTGSPKNIFISPEMLKPAEESPKRKRTIRIKTKGGERFISR